MRLPRQAGKAPDSLTAALIPRLHNLQIRPHASNAVSSAHRPDSTRSIGTLNSMLRNAAEEHERSQSSQQSSKNPSIQAFRDASNRPFNPGYQNPLRSTSTNILSKPRNGQTFSASVAGIKRTSSGLGKSLKGSFEEGCGSQQQPFVVADVSPHKTSAAHSVPAVQFDENDFDSDIDLEIEEPKPLKTAAYPQPSRQQAQSSQSKSAFRPTAPRQQQAQHSALIDDDIVTESAYAPIASHSSNHVNSSAPLPWSSSPSEHYKSLHVSDASQQVTRNSEMQNAAPAKKRFLPWSSEDKETTVPSTDSSISNNSKAPKLGMFTPRSRATKKDINPWNTSASAVKQQQRQHREEKKRSAQQQDEVEEVVAKKTTSKKGPAQIFLSDEQKHVLKLVVEKQKSVFFTGSAGTGKSVLMREIISSLRKKYSREPDRVAVTASTGLAACNVGGVTLHSFAGIGLGKEEVPELVRKVKRNQKARHRWLRTKVLVVDEVSMVDGDLFDKLESIARTIRNNARPFGGIQLVITGDFFQLPPVPDSNRVAKFAFDAATWPTSVEHTIALHHVFRQKDPIFAGMLNEMREGRLSDASTRAFRGLSRDLNFEDMLEATELFPTRAEVDRANSGRLQLLQGNVHIFSARDGGSITDKVQRDRLLQNCMAPESITLKKGAQVMLIKNIDESLVNGSIGRVIGFFTDSEFDRYNIGDQSFPQSPGGTIQTTQGNGVSVEDMSKRRPTEGVTTAQRWPLVRFNLVDGTWRELLCQPEAWKIELPNGEVQASRTQLPLILAWALSIHKAQGQTLDRVKVDLGKVFEKGQAYVALSRATNMAGLQVLRFDPKKVNAHERVRTFYSNLSRVELQNKAQVDKKSGLTAQEYERQFVDDDF